MTETSSNEHSIPAVDALDVLVLGCGTVGYAVTRRMAADLRLVGRIDRLTLLDFDSIEEKNRHTCPEYEGHAGKTKSDRLAELADRWRGEAAARLLGDGVGIELHVRAIDCNAATFDYGRWMSEIERGRTAPLVVLALDDPDLRIGLDWPLRIAAEDTDHATGAVMIQGSLDKDMAQVCCLGLRWDDSCQRCGLSAIPQKAPCVLFSEGELVRGDLQREAREIADLTGRICQDRLDGLGRWRNTRTFVTLDGEDGTIRNISTRPRLKCRGCGSAHDRSLAPMTF